MNEDLFVFCLNGLDERGREVSLKFLSFRVCSVQTDDGNEVFSMECFDIKLRRFRCLQTIYSDSSHTEIEFFKKEEIGLLIESLRSPTVSLTADHSNDVIKSLRFSTGSNENTLCFVLHEKQELEDRRVHINVIRGMYDEERKIRDVREEEFVTENGRLQSELSASQKKIDDLVSQVKKMVDLEKLVVDLKNENTQLKEQVDDLNTVAKNFRDRLSEAKRVDSSSDNKESSSEENKEVVDQEKPVFAPPPPPPPMPTLPDFPPPPPSILGMPPPPPMFGLGSSNQSKPNEDFHVLPKKMKETVSVRLGVIPKRNLHKSIYKKERLLEKGRKKFWTDDVKNILEEKFQVADPNKKKKKKGVARCNSLPSMKSVKKSEKSQSEKKKEKTPLVSGQKSLNGSIITSKIPNKEKLLKDLRTSEEWIYQTNEGHDTIARIRQILSLFTSEEKQKIVNLGKGTSTVGEVTENEENTPKKNEDPQYSDADQFILDLFRVPSLETKLELYEFIINCKSALFDRVKPELDQFITLCEHLRTSKNFKNFLSLVLVITNFLNQGDPGGKGKKKKQKKSGVVIGISVRSLLNLARVRNPMDKSESLMDVIYGIILKDEPEMLSFREKFSSIPKIVEQSPLEEKSEFLKSYEENLEKIGLLMTRLGDDGTSTSKWKPKRKRKKKKDDDNEDKIFSKMGELMPELKSKVKEITKMLKKAENQVHKIADDYGHRRDDIMEFFLVMKDFLISLDKTQVKYEQKEKTRRRKEIRERRKRERLLRKENKRKRKILKLLMETAKKSDSGSSKHENTKGEEGQKGQVTKSVGILAISKLAKVNKQKGKENKKKSLAGIFDAKKKWGVIFTKTEKQVRIRRSVNSLGKWRTMFQQLGIEQNQKQDEPEESNTKHSETSEESTTDNEEKEVETEKKVGLDLGSQWKLLKGLINKDHGVKK